MAKIRSFLLLILLLAILLFCERAKDPYHRVFTRISVHGANPVVAAVIPKGVKEPLPTVIYLHGAHGRAIENGDVLRQFASAGFAAVTLEYSQTSQTDFNAELRALQGWLQRQSWADTNKLVWVGFSLGAQRMLQYYITEPGQAPQVLVRVAGGVVEELRDGTNSPMVMPRHQGQPQVLLFHGENDRVFPWDETVRVGDWFKAHGSNVTSWVLPAEEHAFGRERVWVMRVVADEVAKIYKLERVKTRSTASLQTAKLGLVLLVILVTGWWGPKLLRANPGESKVLRRVALGAVGLAVLVTAWHLILPRVLPAGGYARWFQQALGTDAERDDLGWLATQPEFQAQTCYELIQQVRLAHFRKSFLYEELEQNIFRQYVLSPQVAQQETADLRWRWPFWLELYPKIRKCSNAEVAKEAVVRALRERLGLPCEGAHKSDLMAAWSAGTVTAETYPSILVVSLRSVGVASRLGSGGRAEFWTGKEWKEVVERDNPFETRGKSL